MDYAANKKSASEFVAHFCTKESKGHIIEKMSIQEQNAHLLHFFFAFFTFSKRALFRRDPFRSRGLLLLAFCSPWRTLGHLLPPLAHPEGPFGAVWGVFWAPGAPFWPSDGPSGVPWGAPGSPRGAFRVPGPPFWPSKGSPGLLWGALGPPSGCL